MGLGGEATDFAASIFPEALRTCLMVADPGVALDWGPAAAAVTTSRTFSSMVLAMGATAVATWTVSSSDITGVTILVEP